MVLALLHGDLGDEDSDLGSEADFLYDLVEQSYFCKIIILLTCKTFQREKMCLPIQSLNLICSFRGATAVHTSKTIHFQ